MLNIFIHEISFYDNIAFRIISIIVILLIVIVAYRQKIIDRNKNTALARQLLDNIESERKRIANELHDSLGQELLIIKNRALLALGNKKNKKYILEQLEDISKTVSNALQEIREFSYNLRPYQIDNLGLTKAIQSMIDKTSNITSIQIKSDIEHIDNLIPDEMKIHVFRIIQECINNIIKHSKATTCKINIKRWYNRLNIDVWDNGIGFDYSAIKAKLSQGIGLNGIEDRTKLFGGTMRIESSIGNGTRILITIKTYERIENTN